MVFFGTEGTPRKTQTDGTIMVWEEGVKEGGGGSGWLVGWLAQEEYFELQMLLHKGKDSSYQRKLSMESVVFLGKF